MFRISSLVAVFFLCILTAALATAQPERKNTYYSKWENGLPTDPPYFPIAVWSRSEQAPAASPAAAALRVQGPPLLEAPACDAGSLPPPCADQILR